jgi:hypothetical protein
LGSFSVSPATPVVKNSPRAPFFTDQAVTYPLLEFFRSFDFKTEARMARHLGGHWKIAQPLYDRISLGSFGQAFVPMFLESGTLSYASYLLAPAPELFGFQTITRLVLVVVSLRLFWALMHAVGPESVAYLRKGQGRAAWRALQFHEAKTSDVNKIQQWVSMSWMAAYMGTGLVHHFSMIQSFPLMDRLFTFLLFGLAVNVPHFLVDRSATKNLQGRKIYWAEVRLAYRKAVHHYQSHPDWPALPAEWSEDLNRPGAFTFIRRLPQLSSEEIVKTLVPILKQSLSDEDPRRAAGSLQRSIIFLALLDAGWRLLESSIPYTTIQPFLDKIGFAAHFLVHDHEKTMKEHYSLWRQFKDWDQLHDRLVKLIRWIKKEVSLNDVRDYVKQHHFKMPLSKKGAVFLSSQEINSTKLVKPLAAHLSELVKAQLASAELDDGKIKFIVEDLNSALENLILEALARQRPHIETLVFVVWDVSPSQFVFRIIDAAADRLLPFTHTPSPSAESLENPYFTVKTQTLFQTENKIIAEAKSEGISIGNQVVIQSVSGGAQGSKTEPHRKRHLPFARGKGSGNAPTLFQRSELTAA